MTTKKVTKPEEVVKPFSKLSKADQRIAIAKDVILSLRRGQYIAETGRYVNLDEIEIKKDAFDVHYDTKLDIQKTLNKVKMCPVCALGACILSLTRFKNKLKWGDVGMNGAAMDSPRTKKLFSSLFSPEQLLLIESAFEGYNPGSDRIADQLFDFNDLTDEQISKVEEFRYRYDEPNDRLVAIMKNIIKNKGIFKL